ncbi:hypothetical protein [uncultured Brevundimonas sp.]|uniref:hypothetical protein n=1 Tax=uncultured Brevundimonas sp. TaxID=213418 RepID=UPI0025D016A8|nr:hypothetical protein [uncultured Brevundimonas sp.]
MTALPEVTATEWQIEDGQGVAVKRTRGADYTFVVDPKQTRELASLEISNSREGIRGRVPLRPYMDPEPGNTFIFDEPDFALSNLKCFVLDVEDDTENDTVVVTFETETDGKYPLAYSQSGSPPPAQELDPYDRTFVTPAQAGDWTLAAETLVENGSSIPIIAFTGACENATAESVIFEFRPVDDPPRLWAGAGVEGPAVERKEVGGPITQGTAYQGAVSYRRGNNVSDRLVLGPVTVGAYAVSAGPAARRLVSQSIDYPFTSDASSIAIAAAFTGVVEGSGATVNFPAGSISGLSNSTQYGVFWKAGAGYEVEAYPATTHMTTGSWIFVGWQATSDGSGGFPSSPPPPPGWGGGGNAPIYQAEIPA